MLSQAGEGFEVIPTKEEFPMPYTRDVSIVIATRNRAESLRTTIVSIHTQVRRGPSAEMVVVDNGSSDATQQVLQQMGKKLEIITLYESSPGKSRSLNRALEVVRGELLVFTDDDVTVSNYWIPNLYEASRKYPQAKIFCGPIVPKFPAGAPARLCNHSYFTALFGAFLPKLEEGPLPMNLVPFGANFAVRAETAIQQRFRLDLGPSDVNGHMFHEDTDFISRLRKKSGDIIFVPPAYVVHRVTKEQIEHPSLCERAFYHGRDRVLDVKRPLFLHSTFALSGMPPDSAETRRKEQEILLNFYYGQQYQLWREDIHEFDAKFNTAYAELEADNKHSIAAPAQPMHNSHIIGSAKAASN